MKKMLSLIALGLMFSVTFAQSSTTTTTTTTSNNRWRLGLKVMPGVSYFKSNKSTMSADAAGFAIGGGLQIEYAMTKTASFCTGIEIMKHSGTVGFPDTTYLYNNDAFKQILNRTYSIQSIDIPLSLKLKTNEIGYFTYWAQFGILPSFAFKTNASHNNYSDGTSSTEDIDTYNDMAFVRASVMAGLGVEYGFAGSTALLIGINYVDGFTPTTSWNGTSKTLSTTPTLQSPGVVKNALSQNLSSKYFTLSVGLLF